MPFIYGNGNHIGLRPKDREILLPRGGISRAYVPAFGLHSGPRDAPTWEEDFPILRPSADVIPTILEAQNQHF